MNRIPQCGDLVENPAGTPALVVNLGACGDPQCSGDLQVELFASDGRTSPLCYRRTDLTVIARAADLRVE